MSQEQMLQRVDLMQQPRSTGGGDERSGGWVGFGVSVDDGVAGKLCQPGMQATVVDDCKRRRFG